MRKRAWLILLGAIAVVALALWLNRPPPEPRYKGHPLSYWVLESYVGYPDKDVDFEAIDKIGTNAVPYLVRWWAYEPPPWKVRLAWQSTRLRPERLRDLALRLLANRSDRLAPPSEIALVHLGTNADSAVPALAAMLQETNSPQCYKAIQILARLSTPASMSPLAAVIADPRHPLRGEALYCTCYTATHLPANIIPVLTQCLADTNYSTAGLAAQSLGIQSSAPGLAVSSLTNYLASSKSVAVHQTAIISLGRLGGQAKDALPALTNALTDPSYDWRYAATNAIREITSDLATNSPPNR